MALILNHFFSEVLTECNSMSLIIPVEVCKKERYPVLWLLPPAGYDHTAWQRRTGIEQLAEKYGIMIVMPDMKLSYGLNMAYGFSYFKMLTEELPKMVQEYFPADMNRQIIGGVEEGAYAAMMSALRFPENYKVAIALSGGSLTNEKVEEKHKKQVENAFGTSDLSMLSHSEADLAYWIGRQECSMQKVYVAYSEKDRYGHSANLLVHDLQPVFNKRLNVETSDEPLAWSGWEKLLDKYLGKEWEQA